ncbi:hypothetical protein BDV19DRAFT_180538 [Aspergillus venezuelensis]
MGGIECARGLVLRFASRRGLASAGLVLELASWGRKVSWVAEGDWRDRGSGGRGTYLCRSYQSRRRRPGPRTSRTPWRCGSATTLAITNLSERDINYDAALTARKMEVVGTAGSGGQMSIV